MLQMNEFERKIYNKDQKYDVMVMVKTLKVCNI